MVNQGGAQPEALISGGGAWPSSGAGLSGLLCCGSVSFSRRYQPGWPAEVGQVVTTSRRWRFRKVQRWGICVGRTQGVQIQSGLVQALLQACGGIQCFVPLVWGRLGHVREEEDTAAATALALHLQRLPGQRMGGVGSGAPPGAHRGLESKPTERWVLETRPAVADHLLLWLE